MVTKRKNRAHGAYRVRLFFDAEIFAQGSFTKKADAKKFETKKRREIELMRSGLGRTDEKILVIEYAKSFDAKRLSEVEKGEITLPTYEADEKNLRLYILPIMGKRPMQLILTPEWRALFGFIQDKEGLSNATYNRIRSTAQTMYSYAVAEGVAHFNPINGVPRKSEKVKRRKKKFWETEAECRLYLEGARAEGEGFSMAAAVLINTGARVAEACVIQLADVELDQETRGGTIHIRQILEQTSGSIKDRTKSGEGVGRYVPITEELYDAIVGHLATTRFKAPTDFLIHNEHGKMIGPDRILDAHYRVCKAMKLKRITVHELRTTFATLQRAKGTPMDDVKDVLGHSSTIVTQVYAQNTKASMKEKRIKGVSAPQPGGQNVVKLRGQK